MTRGEDRRANRQQRTGVDRFFTLPGAAKQWGLGIRQVRRAYELGQLPGYEIGRWPRVRGSDVENWLARRRRPPGAPEGGER